MHRGGAEHSAAKLSQILSDNHDVFIATFYNEAIFPDSFEYAGRKICLNQSLAGFSFFTVIRRFLFVRHLKRSLSIDVVISFLRSADLINALTARKTERNIINIRTSFKMLTATFLSGILYKYIMSRSDAVVVQNRSNKKLIDAWSTKDSRTVVIPNFYNIKQIRARAEFGVPIKKNQQSKILITVGTLYPPKGQRHIFKMLRELKGDEIDFQYLLVGEGEYLKDYQHYAQSLGLEVRDYCHVDYDQIELDDADVFFLGFRNNPYPFLKSADLFLLPSYYEGSPNALVEAMVCGLPVLAADCEVGPRDLLQFEGGEYPGLAAYGMLAPVLDEAQLATPQVLFPTEWLWLDAIRMNFADPQASDQRSILAKRAMEKYDQKSILKDWDKLVVGS